MNASQRRIDIQHNLTIDGQILVEDLTDKYQVSAVTIRSDLNLLANKGLIIRSRGGAIAINNASHELTLQQKVSSQLRTKKRLAKAACELINNGDSIILDSGTTTAEIANQLGQFNNLVVMTNGLNVVHNLVNAVDRSKTSSASTLSDNSYNEPVDNEPVDNQPVDNEPIDILTTGGTLRHKSLSFYGHQAEQAIKDMYFDKVLLGVDGFDFNAGLTTHFEYEAQLNRIMCQTAKQVIVVTDSSKFNRCGVHKICNLNQIHTLVTDDKIPNSFIKALKQKGVRLVIVASEQESSSKETTSNSNQ